MKTLRRETDLWVIRGTLRGDDVSIVVEAPLRSEAECIGLKKGIDVVFIDVASRSDIATARAQGLLWGYTPQPRLMALGRPVSHREAACLVLCGWAVVVLNLHVNHVPLGLLPGSWF